LDDIPEDVIAEYKLNAKATKDGYVYVEVRKGMYGLPQAGILAQELLETRLAEHGYHQSTYTPGFWKHKSRPTQFSLVVDDFGVKYTSNEHAHHLIKVLKEHYEITEDWEGTKYLGVDLDWDYDKREVHLSMRKYVQNALHRFQHEPPKRKQNQPYPHVPIDYGVKTQLVRPEDDSPLLGQEDKQFIMQVTGVFLYYARAVDGTMLTALSAIASEQANPTKNTMRKCKQFLDYAASQEDAILTYRASDMVLAIHSDASYLNEPKARSRIGGHHFLSTNDAIPANNGAVLNISKVLKAVMSSAAESELGALFVNAKHAVPQRTTLEEMGHPQPRTPMQTDNSTAYGVVNHKIQPKATKAMDMRFHWLRDRECQNQFRIYWRPGPTNKADYWTKHHAGKHHQNFRPEILTSTNILVALKQVLAKKHLSVVKPLMARVC
jgi:hypothetical protein